MSKQCIIIAGALVLFTIFSCMNASGQAFKKGSLLISMSEGYTNANYATTNTVNDGVAKKNIDGDRDPLTVEYGLSKHWGVGLNLGGDILHINPSSFYGFSIPGNRAKVITSEITADVHYHFFVTKRVDLSALTSLGLSGVSITGNNGDGAYQYNAGGAIARVGGEARYYACKRFGFLGMLSAYSASYSTKGAKGNAVGNNYSTTISGYAVEFGICFRMLK